MNHVLTSLMVAILLASAQARAAPTNMQAQTTRCSQSANLIACSDALGNRYSVATAGPVSYVRGFEVQGNRLWAQTNSRYGMLTFFTGLASNGDAWIGYSQRVGWTTITRVSSSDGKRSKFTCNRMGGCQ
ncbi:glutamine synthetase [Pseudomonas sp. CCI3.2]|uniref:glutamine synthetase n=1 Tax=unclassified Pseudomonas TaxID=196821 RepID=UPI002AC9BC51|nr:MULTISPECIES: glutamine synthetase [unclassified Pseudomonas]MEB0079691.1 glutamine synthetase [Pseudomonas sp. MH10out]MEB0103445.1 glutamine synthetase [Pseudomonas sp. CCI3.2]MEB0132202.1 glutamine synthetase [Pseudomonas sp. CCI2.4]MEB0157836.1 glutamine synthetase [Pseudomonas sp. AH2 (2023)]MEB0169540.1 glutamine synthetase [Pseudomonas sp. CCC4.4]